MTDWNLWRKCRICHAPTGRPCLSRSGSLSGAARPMLVPHASRRKRTMRISKKVK